MLHPRSPESYDLHTEAISHLASQRSRAVGVCWCFDTWDLSWGIVDGLEFALKDCGARAGGISLGFGMAQSLEMARRFITPDTAL